MQCAEKLTSELSEPCTASEVERAMGVTGRDEVLFIRGVNIFVSDQDLEIEEDFSCGIANESPRAWWVGPAFSISELGFWFFNLIFGKRRFMEDFPLDEAGPGDAFPLASEGVVGVRRKFTFLGVGVGVGGIFIWTNSWEATSVLEGICKKRFCFLQCLLVDVSSVIPQESSTWKGTRW